MIKKILLLLSIILVAFYFYVINLEVKFEVPESPNFDISQFSDAAGFNNIFNPDEFIEMKGKLNSDYLSAVRLIPRGKWYKNKKDPSLSVFSVNGDIAIIRSQLSFKNQDVINQYESFLRGEYLVSEEKIDRKGYFVLTNKLTNTIEISSSREFLEQSINRLKSKIDISSISYQHTNMYSEVDYNNRTAIETYVLAARSVDLDSLSKQKSVIENEINSLEKKLGSLNKTMLDSQFIFKLKYLFNKDI